MKTSSSLQALAQLDRERRCGKLAAQHKGRTRPTTEVSEVSPLHTIEKPNTFAHRNLVDMEYSQETMGYTYPASEKPINTESEKTSEPTIEDDETRKDSETSQARDDPPICHGDVLCCAMICICIFCSGAALASLGESLILRRIELRLLKRAFSWCKEACDSI